MADDPISTPSSSNDIIGPIKEALRGNMKDIIDEAIEYVIKKIPALGGKLGTAVEGAIESVGLGGLEEELSGVLQKGAGKLTDYIGAATVGAIDIATLFKSGGSLTGPLKEIASSAASFVGENKIDLTKMFVFDKMADVIQKHIPKEMVEINNKIKGYTGDFAGSIASMQGAMADLGNEGFSDNIAISIKQVANSMSVLKSNAGDTRAAMKTMLESGINTGDLAELKLSSETVGGVAQAFEGLTAAMALAKGTGQDYGSVSKDITKLTRELGQNIDNVGQTYGMLKMAQEGTNLSFRDVKDAVMTGVESLKFYGDNTKAVTEIFKGFVDSVGKGKEKLAVPIVLGMVNDIARMDFAKKSFLGQEMSPGMGAIPAGLKMEQLLSSGKPEDMEKIMDTLKETIEKQTGSKMLTFERAMNGTQADQESYYTQRTLLQKYMPSITDDKINMAMNYAGGDKSTDVQDLFKNNKAGQEAIAKTAQSNVMATEGVLGVTANAVQAEVVSSLSSMSKSYLENTEKISTATDKMIDAFKSIHNKIRDEFSKDKMALAIAHEKDTNVLPFEDVKPIPGVSRIEDTNSAASALKLGVGILEDRSTQASQLMLNKQDIYRMPETPSLGTPRLQFDMSKTFPLPTMEVDKAIQATQPNSSSTPSSNGPTGSNASVSKMADMVANLKLNISIDQSGMLNIKEHMVEVARVQIKDNHISALA